MLKKTELKGTVYNDLNWNDLKLNKLQSVVRLKLNPNRFKIRDAARVQTTDATERATKTVPRIQCGETYAALSCSLWVDTSDGKELKNIAVLEANNEVSMLVFERNVGVIELIPTNGMHENIYQYMQVWPGCKDSLYFDKTNMDWLCEIIDETKVAQKSVTRTDLETDARVLIKSNNNLDFIYTLAQSKGYRGEKNQNTVKLFLNSLAAQDPQGIIDAFSAPEIVKLRMQVGDALSSGIIDYKPSSGYLGFEGAAGKELVPSNPNEDFNDRVSKLLVHFGRKGNESDLILLKSKLNKVEDDLFTLPDPPKKGPFGRPLPPPPPTEEG